MILCCAVLCLVGCRKFKSIPGLYPYVASRTASFDNRLMSAGIAIPLRGKIFPGCKLLLYAVLEAPPPRRNYPAQLSVVPGSGYLPSAALMEVFYFGLPRGNHWPHAATEHFKCGWHDQRTEFLKFISFELIFISVTTSVG